MNRLFILPSKLSQKDYEAIKYCYIHHGTISKKWYLYQNGNLIKVFNFRSDATNYFLEQIYNKKG
jgi:hypothetical protein